MMNDKVKPDNQDEDEQTPLLEWVCGAIGLMLFGAVVILTIMNGVDDGGPPSFRVEVSERMEDAAGHHVRFDVVNAGDEAAVAVRVRAEVAGGRGADDSREVEIDLLPPRSRRSASVIFDKPPADADLVFSVLSYRAP